jgi:hypothetical protein
MATRIKSQNRVPRTDLTLARLRELLIYEPEIGLFRWLQRKGGMISGDVAGGSTPYGYVTIGIDGRRYMAHRLAVLYMTDAWPIADVDHVNGERADNRWANLRQATRRQNLGNMKLRPVSTTGFKGVIYEARRCKFRADIRCGGGKSRYLGRFDTALEAHEAYMAAAREIFGEFARAL